MGDYNICSNTGKSKDATMEGKKGGKDVKRIKSLKVFGRNFLSCKELKHCNYK